MEFVITFLVTFFRRHGRRPRHRLCGHERRGGHQPHAHHFPRHGPLYGGRHRALVRRAGKRCVRLHLRKKQKPRHPQRPHHDGMRAGLHRGRQLHCKPCPLGHDGWLLGLYDLPARREVHRPPRHDDQGGHGRREREKSAPCSLFSAACSSALSAASSARAAA